MCDDEAKPNPYLHQKPLTPEEREAMRRSHQRLAARRAKAVAKDWNAIAEVFYRENAGEDDDDGRNKL